MASIRNLLILGIGLLIAYWLDQRYYGGTYSQPLVDLLHRIANGSR